MQKIETVEQFTQAIDALHVFMDSINGGRALVNKTSGDDLVGFSFISADAQSAEYYEPLIRRLDDRFEKDPDRPVFITGVDLIEKLRAKRDLLSIGAKTFRPDDSYNSGVVVANWRIKEWLDKVIALYEDDQKIG